MRIGKNKKSCLHGQNEINGTQWRPEQTFIRIYFFPSSVRIAHKQVPLLLIMKYIAIIKM